jgi:hypothetical protein
LPEDFSNWAWLNDSTFYVGMGNGIQRYNRTKNATTTAVTYTAVGSPFGVASTGRQFTICNGMITVPRGTNLIDMISADTLHSINTLTSITPNRITTLSCSLGGSVLVITDETGAVYQYSLTSKALIGKPMRDTTRTGVPAYAELNPSGTAFIAANFTQRYQTGTGSSNTPLILNLSGGAATMYFPALSARDPIIAVAYGMHAATAAGDNTIRVYSNKSPGDTTHTESSGVLTASQFPEHCIMQTPGTPTALTYSATAETFAVGVPTGTSTNKVIIYRYNTQSSKAGCDKIFEADNSVANSPIRGLHFTADGQLEIASGHRIVSMVANK